MKISGRFLILEVVMANPRVDPYRNFNFIVEIDGIAKAAFQEVSGLGAEVDVVEYREGGDTSGAVRKLPGRVRYFPITLKRGITQDKSLWNWFKTVVNGAIQRANGSVVLLDSSRNEVLRWNFRDAWPSKWEGPSLCGEGNEIAIEILEIQHEGIELE
jgi:phage tail-like protein